jgi:hypothetical protein
LYSESFESFVERNAIALLASFQQALLHRFIAEQVMGFEFGHDLTPGGDWHHHAGDISVIVRDVLDALGIHEYSPSFIETGDAAIRSLSKGAFTILIAS